MLSLAMAQVLLCVGEIMSGGAFMKSMTLENS